MAQQSTPTRHASALVLVMAFVLIGGMAITVSTNLLHDRFDRLERHGQQAKAIGALEAVLTRQESAVVTLAAAGDPAQFHRFHANYGDELFGGCRIRWKIEPAIIREAEEQGDIDGDGVADNHRFITNPPPDIGSVSDIPVDLQNDFMYLYRIAGEARYLPGGGEWDDDVEARVQGVRYVAFTKQPVFRYVIFYAQEGPKGDLEFSHVPAMDVGGNVQCNGAIYLGSGTVVNDWYSLNPTSEPTRLGPDEHGEPVRVNGAYGIFRLSKHGLFSAFHPDIRSQTNGSSTNGVSAAFDPDGSHYQSDPALLFPGETGNDPVYLPPVAAGDDIFDATHGATIINPNRVLADQLATTGGERSINGIPVHGLDSDGFQANDSRRAEWKSEAMLGPPRGFNGYARTAANGGSVLRLPSSMGDRAFEVQRVLYQDLDGDPSTDEHEYAQPLFVDGDGNATATIPTSGPIVEAIGTYAGYALGWETGHDLYFKRRHAGDWPVDYADGGDRCFNGWVVTDDPQNGTSALAGGFGRYTASDFGLVIRERPRPDVSYFTIANPTALDDEWYLPFAYGKHTRSTLWPFWSMDVVGTRGKDDAGVTGDWRTDDFEHFDKAAEFQSYAEGGILRFSAAMDPGPDDGDADYDGDQDGWWDSQSGYRRYPMYYRNNWRFIHWGRPSIDEAERGTGLTGTYYDDRDFGSVPSLHRVDERVDFDWGGGSPASGMDDNDFCVIWMGFISPPTDGSYRFIGYCDDGVRIWVDGQLVVDHWTDAGAEDKVTRDILLEAGRDYSICMEYYENGGDAQASLRWRRPGMAEGTSEVVPVDYLSPHRESAFDRDDVLAVQVRLDDIDGPDYAKVGLMLRGEEQVYAAGGPGSGSGTILQLNQIALLSFDEASGSLAEDGTGNNHNGSLQNGAFFEPAGGRSVAAGGAVRLDGGNDSVDIASSSMINSTTVEQRTVSLWFKPDDISVNSRKQVLFEEGGSSRGLVIYLFDGELWFGGWNKPTNESGWEGTWVPVGGLANDTWHHAMLTLEGVDTVTSGAMKCYLDGDLVHSVDGSKLWSHGDAIGVGNINGGTVFHDGDQSGNGHGFTGMIDELRVYDLAHDDDFAKGAAGKGSIDLNLPHEHLSPIQDGRSPYLALCYSPERGVFVEFRGDRAHTETVRQYTWFVGSNGGLPVAEIDSGETGVDPGMLSRTVTLTPSDITPADPTSEQTNEYIQDRTRQTIDPVETWQDIGDGWSLHWYKGVIEREQSKRARRWKRKTLIERWRFDLGTRDNPLSQVFVNADRWNDIDFFLDTSGSTTVWSTRLDNNWQVESTWLQRQWTSQRSGTNYNPSDFWDPAYTATEQYPTMLPSGGGDFVAWHYGSYKGYKQKGGTVDKLSASELTTELKALDNRYQVYTDPGWPVVADPDYPEWPEPSEPSIGGTWADHAASAGVAATGPRTFSVERHRDIDSDVNSFTSATGYRHESPVRQFKPWPDWATELPPTTHTFRPDLWHGPLPPASNSDVASPTSLPPQSGNQRPNGPWNDDLPLHPGEGEHLWLRMARAASGQPFTLYYAIAGEAAPDPGAFIAVPDHSGMPLAIPAETFRRQIQIGACLQSGDRDAVAEAVLAEMSIEFDPAGDTTTEADPILTLDHADWDGIDSEGATRQARYLCSQYQVFWGPYDITEHFFTYVDPTGDGIASEDWIYNTREFWSQSRWWADGVDKDGIAYMDGNGSVRELLAKQTLLSIDLKSLQNYFLHIGLQDALANSVEGGYGDPPELGSSPLLKDRFNGLLYIARCNRYPWNPNLDEDNANGANPWTWPEPMPNDSDGLGFSSASDLMAMSSRDRSERFAYQVTGEDPVGGSISESTVVVNNRHLNGTASGDPVAFGDLQPYPLDRAPAFKPQEFHHGVRLHDGAAFDWGLGVTNSGDAVSGTPEFGLSKTTVVTPNQLYIQGDLNTNTYDAEVDGQVVADKWTPVAVFGDMVTLLSNAWDDDDWREPGIVADAGAVLDGGSLYRPFADPDSALDRYLTRAQSTGYFASIVTHNQPTTMRSVRNGEAATVISVMQYLEDWTDREMHFRGSLVVMDSRRSTTSYLLDTNKDYGVSPCGVMGWHIGRGYHEDGLRSDAFDPALGWSGRLKPVYAAPNRVFDFNPDLLSEAGTPPFTPFGVTSTGTGAWVRVLQ